MGFDLVLIATNANGLKVPSAAKCCICYNLLDDGVGLSGCSHNACYKCMKKISEYDAKCPLDGKSFDMRRYFHLSEEIEGWLSQIKLKCGWFDGQICTATAISLRNARHHREVCPNNPRNKKSLEQRDAIEFVQNWMQNNEVMRGDHTSDSDSADPHQRKSDEISAASGRAFRPGNGGHKKPRSGYGFRPNKRTHGNRFSTSEMDPECDSDWRK